MECVKEENECCFCFRNEDLFSMLEPYSFEDKFEIYSTMIAECFQIELNSYVEEYNKNLYLICENCVFRLRDAVLLRSQVQIAYDRLQAKCDKKNNHADISTECTDIVKTDETIMLNANYCKMEVDDHTPTDCLDIAKMKTKILNHDISKNDNVTVDFAASFSIENVLEKDVNVKMENIILISAKEPIKKLKNTHEEYVYCKGEDRLNDKFICDICGNVFRRKNNLRNHMMCHLVISTTFPVIEDKSISHKEEQKRIRSSNPSTFSQNQTFHNSSFSEFSSSSFLEPSSSESLSKLLFPNPSSLEPSLSNSHSPKPITEKSSPLAIQCSTSKSTRLETLVDGETIPDNYVFNKLMSTSKGRCLLNSKHLILQEYQRTLLVRLLLSPIDFVDKRISYTRLEMLAEQIVEVFEKEKASVYYYQPPFQPKKNINGKLYNYIRTLRCKLKQKKECIQNKSCKNNLHDVSAGKIVTATAEEQHKLTWLENFTEPWDLVQDYWRATTERRRRYRLEDDEYNRNYFQKYPALKSPEGYKLLIMDFNREYQNVTHSLSEKIIFLADKILKVASDKAKRTNNDAILRISSIVESGTQETKINCILMLLPYLLSNRPIKTKKRTWRPSIVETMNGYIMQITSDDELETSLSTRREKMSHYGITCQPIVVSVGPTLNETSHCYVVIQDVLYKFKDLVTAVDACFKIVHATGSQFQDESCPIWMFLQKAFYNIQSPQDKYFVTVLNLMLNLELTF